MYKVDLKIPYKYTVQGKNMFKLRTKPTQFVKGKTDETLCDTMKRYEENNLISANDIDNYDDIKTHLIEIIVTNNSLLETQMWKYRTANKFKEDSDIKIHILSSKSTDFTDIDSYISNIQQSTNKNELPNVLIVCYHSKRVSSDIIKLCNTFGGLHPMILPNIEQQYKIKFHVSFDEPDANINVTKKFLSKVKKYIYNKTIIGVLFITATPIDKFWNMLNKSGIKQLFNMNKDTIHNFDDDLESYRCFEDHNVLEYNNDTNNPLEYIQDLFSKKKINETIRKIIFTPGHNYTEKGGVGSHDEIKAYFLGKDYVVILLNGKFKGFIYPNGTKKTIDEYNDTHKIKGELRETLQHWSENNKKTNLAITGYSVIERGVTFNTINFNFTDMILSNYHLKTLSKLIQLSGRGAGGKKYVDIMNVFCTTDIKNAIEYFNVQHKKICSLNPDSFNRSDFSKTNNTIPVKLTINDNVLLKELVELKTKFKKGYKSKFHSLLVKGINDNSISIYDNNNINKFDINSRTIRDVRMYDETDILNKFNKDFNSGKTKLTYENYLKKKKENRRFKNFSEAFNNFKTTSQSCNETEYNIDFAKDTYKLNDFINETNVLWITFKI